MVDLSAPGYDIVTPNDQGPGYKYNMGTSFASPIVTGIVGLMVDANPCLYPDEIESILKLR